MEECRSALLKLMLETSSKKKRRGSMSTFKMTRTFRIMMAAILAAGVASAALAASDRSRKFVPPIWPEETIYRPECKIVQADGSWLRCVPAERDW
jgi:hypothetical protein